MELSWPALDSAVWTAAVLAGQVCFAGRILLQWWRSEQAGRSVAPRGYWTWSLVGALLGSLGAAGQGERLLIPAFVISGALYLRNWTLGSDRGNRSKANTLSGWWAAALGLACSALLIALAPAGSETGSSGPWPWLALGVVGQTVWSVRFVVQWWASERKGVSHFPAVFWRLTLLGAVCNLAYTLWLGQPEFVIAYLFSWWPPIRNLQLMRRAKRVAATTSKPSPAPARSRTYP